LTPRSATIIRRIAKLEIPAAVYLARRDFRTPEEMRTAFARLHDASVAIIDCSDGEHLDFSFLLQLTELRNYMWKRNGEVRLVVHSEDARRTLAVTGLDSAFTIFESMSDAERISGD
jgi:anti-anti-sigma regulatory factor